MIDDLRSYIKIRKYLNRYTLEKLDLELIEQWLDDPSFTNWAKQSDDIDIAKWEAYLNTHPEKWELAKIGKDIALGISFKPISSDKSRANKSLSTLLSKIEKEEVINPTQKQHQAPKGHSFRMHRRLTIAASLAFLVMVSGYYSYIQFFQNTEIHETTGYGVQKEIVLPEGSLVTLNANSSLTYQKNNPRNIHLVGEAFFEVEKIIETNEKFRVHTQDMVISVLGTSFNVNARNDQTKVFLEEGIVELVIEDDAKEIIKMNPGDVISYSKKELKVKENRQNVSILENASWKDGALIFNNTPLIDALYDIEDIYGIQFVIESENLRTEEITGGVPIKDLTVTLETLHEVYDIQIKSEGQRYFISRLEE